MEIGIIGAGAAGLMAAVTAAGCGASVTLFEGNDKVGKKLLVTGNGKCNFTNLLMSPECYNETSREFVNKALNIFDEKATIDFFEKAGMLSKDKNGYVYPYSEQAQAVQDIFIMECRKHDVKLEKGAIIERISEKGSGFTIGYNDKNMYFDKVIIACGGMASAKSGSDGNGYALAEGFGHKLVKPVPSLVQLKGSDKYFKELAGVRCECSISFMINDKVIGSEVGEVQFADYGLSGIPVFQFSGRVARALTENKRCKAVIDFLPVVTKEELIKLLNNRKKQSNDKTIMEFMIGFFNWNINKVIIKRAGLNSSKSASSLTNADINKLAEYIKNFDATITDTNGFDRAQVTSGGVMLSEINADTMESRLKKGLYFAGEIMDVDGRCGGYNLQWAWTSGHIAGRAAAND